MSINRWSTVAAASISLIVSCGAAKFTGGSRTGQNKPKLNNPSTEPMPGTNPDGTNPSGTNPSGTNPSGTNPSGTNPNSSTPQIGPNSQVAQPNVNTIVFGLDQVFHICDGRYNNTSCMQEVSALPLAGDAFFFQFEVLGDSTDLNIEVAKLCGVDYTTNTFELYAGNARLQGQAVPGAAPGLVSPPVSLKKGIYTIILASGWGHLAGQTRNDLDDFIVGSVTVKGSKPVKAIRYGSYNRK